MVIPAASIAVIERQRIIGLTPGLLFLAVLGSALVQAGVGVGNLQWPRGPARGLERSFFPALSAKRCPSGSPPGASCGEGAGKKIV
jgi:hypothetical protein